MREAVIVECLRTPVGRYRGGLAPVRPDDLGAIVIKAVVEKSGIDPALIDECYWGAANQAGEDNRNAARMAVLLAGLPDSVPGTTVNRLCASGLEAVAIAARMIEANHGDVFIAGGAESMSRAPLVMPKPDEAWCRGNQTMYDTTLGWRYPNPKMAARFELQSMGETAENVAEKHSISREDQDAFALESHRRAAAAWEKNEFASEIVPIEVPQHKGDPIQFSRDECIRKDASIEALAKLKPVFRKGGSVTAGNSSPINDGASALLLVSEEVAKASGAAPLARVVATQTAGVEPNFMGEGPIPAVKKLLARTGHKIGDVDRFELNEAFAAQALACVRALEIDPKRVNPLGGAIALGHPIGSSGARIAATLVHAMAKQGEKRGVAALCIGVGQGIAALFERP